MSGFQRTSWEKHGPFWQKRHLGESNKLKITYHYQKKHNKQCQILEINTIMSQELIEYMLIEKDLRDSIVLMEDNLNIFNEIKTVFSKNIMGKALMKAVLVSYAKCFNDARGRKFHLNDNFIDEKYRDLHRELIRMRNKYVSHADKTIYEGSHYVLPLPPEAKYTRGKGVPVGFFKEVYQTAWTSDFPEKVILLLKEVNSKVKDKIIELENKIVKDLKALNPEKVYAFVKKKGERIVINDTDLENLKK